MHDCVIDIETKAPEWGELDETTQEYLTERAMKRDKLDYEHGEAAAKEELAFDIGLAHIVAIGMWMVDASAPPYIILQAPMSTMVMTTAAQVACFEDEATMLSRFWHVLRRSNAKRIITFNGRAFDGPKLMVRSAMLDIRAGKNLVPYRYDISEHCDLYDVLTFFGACRGYSLDYWSRRFGIASPKEGGITGADVGRLHTEGRFVEIAEYLAGDLIATAALYKRLLPSLLWTFKGGPVALPA